MDDYGAAVSSHTAVSMITFIKNNAHRVNRKARILLFFLMGLGIVLACIAFECRDILIPEIRALIAVLHGWVSALPPVAYFGVFAVALTLGAPILPFYLMASAYGIGIGILGCLITQMIAISLSYVLARNILHPQIERIVLKLGYVIPKVPKGKEAMVTILVRISGLPFFAQNYLLGLSGIPFVPYFIYSFPVNIGFTVAIVLMGESLFQGKSGMALMGLSIFVLLVIILRVVRTRLNRQKNETDALVG
jgi:uncharacterized membrane protein YdjX (TVP38/TMEM64 family)